MSSVPAPKLAPNIPAPRAVCLTPVTLWIVSHEEYSSSWRVWKGERTSLALEREIKKERKEGRAAHVELETGACGPVEMSLAELASLGIIDGEVRS